MVKVMPKPIQLLFLILALLAVTIILPGCGLQPTHAISEPLPLPVRPLLPALSASDIACLSDDTYKRLVIRDRLRREYAEELEAIILATHDGIDPRARRPPEN